jgi:hypothetical protein
MLAHAQAGLKQSARLADERLKAYAELVELIGLSEMAPEHMGMA